MPSKQILLKSILLVSCTAWILSHARDPDPAPDSEAPGTPAGSAPVPDREYLEQGEILSGQFCGTCHQYPAPSLLPRKTWLHSVLPAMGTRLGRHYLPQDHVEDYREHESLDYIPSPFFGTGVARQRVLELGGFPEAPLVSHDDWMKIVAFYGETSPPQLEQTPPRTGAGVPTIFREHPVAASEELPDRWISLHFAADRDRLYAGSEKDSSLKHLDPRTFEVRHSSPYPSAPVSIVRDGNFLYVLTVGSMVSTDELEAGVFREDLQAGTTTALFGNLPRSVHLQQVRLGTANPLAFLVSGFGNTVGQVFLMMESPGSWIRLPLSNRQGSIASYFVDMNGDGKREVISLVSAGAEGVYQYRHENEDVIETQLISFPPSYGSNAMKLEDWDGDGDLDIFLTQGDNGDYDPVLKPYHGIRIYENKGADRYEEALFHPLHGASGIEIRDFDLDGDLDIAAISFFPDWKAGNPRGFVFLENDGRGGLHESHLEKGDLARWIVMESGDFDGDGDSDLILGAHHFEYAVPPATVEAWQENPISLLYLENTTR